jgi:fimbrial chaperone protein
MLCALVSALLLLLFAATPAGAFRVLPMTYDLAPIGSGATQLLRVENLGDRPLTVELFAERRDILEDGSERRTPADDDFVIFPPQSIIQPAETRAFRVQYLGEPRLERSVTYAITVAQLPIELDGAAETGVQVVFAFSTLANVVPPGSRAALEVREVRPDPAGGGVLVLVENSGTRYGRVTEGSWTVGNSSGVEVTVAGELLREAIEVGLIQPGTQRLIHLPVPDELVAGGGLRANFTPSGS